MTSSVSLEPVPAKRSWWIKEGDVYRGVLFPPAAPGDAWEIWNRGEWIAHRFDTEDQALAALGIIHPQHEEMAA